MDDSSSDDDWQVLTVFDSGGGRGNSRNEHSTLRKGSESERMRSERSFVSNHSKASFLAVEFLCYTLLPCSLSLHLDQRHKGLASLSFDYA